MKNVVSCLYSDYLRYTDQFRAIPWFIDLLKPVEKRLLLTVHQEAKTKNVKSAKVVGSCFAAGTLVTTDKGLIPIEDIQIGDIVITSTGKQKVIQTFISSNTDKLLKITLNNDIEIKVTKDQKFKILNKMSHHCKSIWKEASKLKSNKEFISLKLENDIGYIQIRSIEEVPWEPTYDIEVENDHELVTNGIISHNCMGNYHPHGDASIYGSLVSLVQRGYVEGIGNFGGQGLVDSTPAAYRYCITGDTLIPTENGTEYIKNISVTEDINLKVLDYQSNPCHASKFFNSGIHPIIGICTNHGYSIKGSANHPIVILNSKLQFEWKLLKDITENDYIVLKNNTYFNNNPNQLSEDEAKLLGGLVSEGWYSNRKIGFSNTNLEFFSEILNCFKNIFPDSKLTLNEQQLPSGKICKSIELCNQQSLEYLNTILDFTPIKSGERYIPAPIWKTTLENQKLFLQYLFYGDGSIHEAAKTAIQLSYSSKSIRLIKELQILLLNFDINSTLNRFDNKKYNRIEHTLVISGLNNIRKFHKTIGFLYEKQIKLENIVNNYTNTKDRAKLDCIPYLKEYLTNCYKTKRINCSTWQEKIKPYHLAHKRVFKEKLHTLTFLKQVEIDHFLNLCDNYKFDKVKTIHHLPEETVYSLRVDSEDHSFIGNGFINHNTEVKANKFLDDGFSEFLNYVPWKQLELEKEPLYLPFYVPIGLIGEGIISGIGLHTTKIPRYAFVDLLKRLYELLTNSPIKTTIIPNILNCDIFEDTKNVSFESILTTGEGIIQCVPKIRLDKDGLHILGQNPITKFNPLVKFNLDHETKNGFEYCTIIDLSSNILDVLVTPKKGAMTNKFIMSIMELISTKIHIKCNVINTSGTVILAPIDELLINAFKYWKDAYLEKLKDDLSKALVRLEELNIIIVIRDILEKNPSVKSVDAICKLNTSKYSNEQISYVAGKHRIKTLIETQVDLQSAQQTITSIQNNITNIHQICLKRIQNLLGI